MRSSIEWSDKIVDKENVKYPIYSLTFNPEGTQLLACCGSQVLVYDALSGDLLQTLKSHKDVIYTIDYSQDGKRFASGGADKTVVIWNSNFEPILKFSHNDSIQYITHNPLTNHVTSVTLVEYGLWSPDQKSVQKFKVPAKITCCAWTRDGQFLALGLFTGSITIRNRSGEELIRIDKGVNPISSLAWNQYGCDEPEDILVCTDWSQELCFFNLSGKALYKPIHLGFDPCCVSYYQKKYLVIGGSDRKVTMWTSDGVRLGEVGDLDGWVWCCRANPKSNRIAVSSQDGTISMFQVTFSTVHGLYQNHYAYRDQMTDVVVQDLYTNRRVRIKCRDHVRKVAIFRNQLAVQLSDRLIIYENAAAKEKNETAFRVKEQIKGKMECNLLVITSRYLVQCQERNLQAYTLTGEKVRNWRLDALIRYIKVVGGPAGKEGLLVGLKNGQIHLVYVDNPFPISIYKHNFSIRCLDLSKSRSKLAIVDDQGSCILYDLAKKVILAQETGASSVSWNTEYEEMVCYSGNGLLYIKASNFPTHRQRMHGFVVGFMGSKIFSLNHSAVVAVDVPQAVSMERFLAGKNFQSAYETACLGVTDDEWRKLAMVSIENFQLEVAKKSFARLQDFKYLELISYIENLKGPSETVKNLCLALYNAYSGQYKEAAILFKKAGESQRAVDMFADLNMWESATKTAAETSTDKKDILKKKAQTHQDKNDLGSAAKTFEEMGEYLQAVIIYGQQKWWDQMIELARSVNKIEIRALEKCVEFFVRNNLLAYAAEVLKKLDDIKRLIDIYIELQRWPEIMELVEMYPNMQEIINLPYAQWLASNEQYREAQIYYRKAGRVDLSIDVLRQLAESAIEQNRFNDAAHFYWALSMEHLMTIPADKTAPALTEEERDHLDTFEFYQLSSQLYYAYHPIYCYTVDPFINIAPISIFNMAIFLLNAIHSSKYHFAKFWINLSVTDTAFPSISITKILYVLGKLSRVLGAYKLGRFVLDRLLNHHVLSASMFQEVELGLLSIKGYPFTDSEVLYPVCWTCGTSNPFLDRAQFDPNLAAEGMTLNDKQRPVDGCFRCQTQFTRSLYTFDTLPLQEFRIDKDIPDEEALVLLSKRRNPFSGEDEKFKEDITEKVQRLAIHDVRAAGASEDSWQQLMESAAGKMAAAGLNGSNTSNPDTIPSLDRKALESLDPSEVFIVRYKQKCIPWRYYRLIQPGSVALTKCQNCHQFFYSEDFEYLQLISDNCPLCRNSWSSITEDLAITSKSPSVSGSRESLIGK